MSSGRSTPTILVVDDYADTLEMLNVFLRAEGFTVISAADGKRALQMATELLPDLAVLDLELPGKSGYEVASCLRLQPATRHIPLIAATGFSHAAQLDRARRSGFDAVIVKPCGPEELIAQIRQLLPAGAWSAGTSAEHTNTEER